MARRLILLFICISLPYSLFAGYSHVSGRWSPDVYAPVLTMQEHYDRGYQALYKNEWDQALVDFMVIVYHFPDSPFYRDALFYSGVSYYYKADLDLATRQFDRYLAQSGKLKHFDNVFEFKFEIAEQYKDGKRRHLFGKEQLPRWASGKGDAITLYDEIIATLPGRELAAKSLYSKAECLRSKKEYRESIEALQTLARQFPKHSLSAESYLEISEIYLAQSRIESQNPDLIALAQVNLQRFRKAFPGDERIDVARSNLLGMKEVYAQSLYDTGRFYERKKKPTASEIYYQDTILKYPETEAAHKSRERLEIIAKR